MAKETKESTKQFDSDLSPRSEHNREVAAKHGLRYDNKKGFYVDEDGGLIRDEFGQPL